jgi:hypothetical protein
VQVTLNEVTYAATVQDDPNALLNTWSITLSEANAKALNHGNTYPVSVQVVDVAGNPTVADQFSLFVNTAYPDVPSVDNLFTHGVMSSGAYAATPTLTGKAAKLASPGADPTVASNYIALAGTDQITIEVSGQTLTGTLNAMPVGLSYYAADKTWSLNTSLVSGFTPLADGTYNVSVTVRAGDITKSEKCLRQWRSFSLFRGRKIPRSIFHHGAAGQKFDSGGVRGEFSFYQHFTHVVRWR